MKHSSKFIKLTVQIVLLSLLLVGCSQPANEPENEPPLLAEELIFYDWSDDGISAVFDAFTEEYGVKITYVAFESTEEAVENIRAGEMYDIAVIENQYIPTLVEEELLAKIDFGHVPNFRNISANFRDLSYDPQNLHTIPYSWGTTGLVVRPDLVSEPVTKWADKWKPELAGQIINWETTPRFTIGAALKSLGHSVNSEDTEELEAALEKLIQLKPNSYWLVEEHSAAPLIVSGDAVVSLGWSEDFWLAQEEIDEVTYVIPEEGSILWGDNFVIPVNSPNKYTAELFLDFILRAEVTAEIVNNIYYPMPNDAAIEFIAPEILSDSVVFPTNAEMQGAEILLPLSPAGDALYEDIWNRFLAAG